MEEYHCKQKEQVRSLTSLKDLKIPSEQDIIIQFTSTKETNGRIQSRGNLIYDNELDQSVHQKFVLIDKYKTQKDYDMLAKSLSNHFIFGQLTSDKDVLTALLDSFVCCEVTTGVYLIEQGQDASSFFVLDSGGLQVQFNGKIKKHIKPHQSFGQIALLHNCPRSASVRASETSILWMITRSVFKSILEQTFKNQYIRARKYIQKLGVFGGLTSRQKDSLANIFKYRCYEKGNVIAEQNKPITSYFFLQKGQVRLFKDNSTTQMQAQIGECICDQILQDDPERIYTIQAGQNCRIYEVNKSSLYKILGKQLHQIMFRNRVFPYLLNSKYFSQLPKNILQKVIDTFDIKTIQAGQVIVNLGYLKRNMMFFILQQYTEDEGPIFLYGQEAILQQNQQDIYRQKIMVDKPSYLAFTNFKKVQAAIQIKFQKLCAKQLKYRQSVREHSLVNQQFKNYSMKLKPSDLFHIKKLAEGSSGGVHLVVDANKRYLYALKCIQRQDIEEKKLEKAVLEQRKALQLSESPFLMQYGRCFKDESYICFLTEFVDGMQFFDVIRFMGLVSPKDSKFYMANIIFALEHLHKRDIIYRGLKPENILVNWDGYLKLTDMKTCKTIVNKNIVPKTFTMVGTPHYIAPEILKAKGYNHAVDLWSLGIILYELVCGSVPFGAYDDDPFDIYEAILKRQIKYPSTLKDIKCKYLIEQLLSRIPQVRLKGSYSALKSHQFFEGIQWDKIFEKKVQPPYKVPEDKLLGRYLNKLNVKKLKTVEDYFMKKNIKCAKISARMSALATSLVNWDENFN